MKKKISIVIGGSKGIGKSIAKELKKRGDKVFILSRSVKNDKTNIRIDITQKEELKAKIFDKIKKNKIDNIIFSQRYRGTSEKELYNTDLFSIENLINLLDKKLNYRASIIFISSISNRTILDDQPLNYHIIRSSIEQMMKFYATKFLKKQIRFNCVLPSKIIKPTNKTFFYKNKRGKKIRELIEFVTPLKRMGTSDDVAKIIKFLTSNESEYITGQSFIVDGGLHLLSQESIINILKKNKNGFKFMSFKYKWFKPFETVSKPKQIDPKLLSKDNGQI